jgi:hypothetical protein
MLAGDELIGAKVVDLAHQQLRRVAPRSKTGEQNRGVLIPITGKQMLVERLVVGAGHAQSELH